MADQIDLRQRLLSRENVPEEEPYLMTPSKAKSDGKPFSPISLRTSRTSQYESLPGSETVDSNLYASSSVKSQAKAQYSVRRKPVASLTRPHEEEKWLPYALQLPWLALVICFGIALFAAVVILHIASNKDHGLAKDEGNRGVYFTYRFLPTLLAVTYMTMLMIVLDAVKRTEPFARLMSKSKPTGHASILNSPGPWWRLLGYSLPTKTNDNHLSLTMLCATIAYILAILAISPFSSALLTVQDISVSNSTIFSRVELGSNGPLPLPMDTPDYFLTVGHMLQNISTSPWITDEYAVVPYWPEKDSRPNGLQLTGSKEAWSAESIVMQADMDCEDLQLLAGPNVDNFTLYLTANVSLSYEITTYRFGIEGGCQYGMVADVFTVPQYTYTRTQEMGLMFWSNFTTRNADTVQGLDLEEWNLDPQVIVNHTDQCQGDVMIILPPANVTNQPFARTCKPTYYQAKLPVSMSSVNDESTITFDHSVYQQVRTPISSNLLNISSFEETYLSFMWSQYLSTPSTNTRPILGGPANLLAALYDFDIIRVLGNPDLITNAKRLRQRAFGEVIQSSLSQIADSVPVEGELIFNDRRILVVPAIAVVLEVALASVTLLLISVCWFSRLTRRPLGLTQDPAFTNTIASLSSSAIPLKQLLRAASSLPASHGKDLLGDHRFGISDGVLHVEEYRGQASLVNDSGPPELTTRTRWRPFVLSKWIIGGLILTLSAVAAAIAVLYWYSITHGLTQSAFVFQVSVDHNDSTLATIAPYAIVPTVLAVSIGLWWGALEGVFRLAQPFLTMSRGATPSSHGSGLSYQSSYLAWAAIRGLVRGHWLLTLVCTGAFLSQILTIAMSALWQRTPDYVQTSTTVGQPFQLREVPHLYAGNIYKASGRQDILTSIFSNLTTSWLYGGLFELRFNGSQPQWSKDGWSFIPVMLPNSTRSEQGQSVNASTTGQSSQMVVEVPAIRGRVECTPLAPGLDAEYYTFEPNMTDAELVSGKPIGPDAWLLNDVIPFEPYNTSLAISQSNMTGYTPVLGNGVELTCCGQDDQGLPSTSYIGYWSPTKMNVNLSITANQIRSQENNNFSAKWIYGPSPAQYYLPNFYGTYNRTVWPEPPQLMMINCEPIFESAKAKITVDRSSLQVQNYTFIDQPTPYLPAWADPFIGHFGYANSSASSNYMQNITTTFGPLFISSLLGAAQIEFLGGCWGGTDCYEHTEDRVFNYREPGLNVDFMSYAMLSLVNNNASALLDYDVMINLTQKVFTTFFAHYASSNVTMNGGGGWVYQRPTETLPTDLKPAYSPWNLTTRAPAQVSAPAAPSIQATMLDTVETLQMSPVAVWLSLVILTWLVITTILILMLKDRYFSPLLRGVDTIADVAMMVAGSDRYLELARMQGATGLRVDKSFRTRLGWFRTSSGDIRWGIELANDPGVEFLTDEEVATLTYAQRRKIGTMEDLSDGDGTEVRYDDGYSDADGFEMRTLVANAPNVWMK